MPAGFALGFAYTPLSMPGFFAAGIRLSASCAFFSPMVVS